MSVTGLVVLVTGASSGLGRSMAMTLARHGAHVAVAARRLDKLEDLEREIRQEQDNRAERAGRATTGAAAAGAAGVGLAAGAKGGGRGRVLALKMDVTDPDSINAAVKQAEESLGPITVLVNNAGVAVDKPALRQTPADWSKCIDTNLTGPWLVAQAVGRRMLKHKTGGSIINIASVAGLAPTSYMPGYCASKAGLVHLTKCLALEWARFGIRVNAICPGYIETDMNKAFFKTPAAEKVLKKIPQQRLGHASDLDALLLLMADSAASGYMTGTIVNVDGGMLVSNL